MDPRLHGLIIGGLWFLLFNFIVGFIMGFLGVPSPRDRPPPAKLLLPRYWQSICLVIPQSSDGGGGAKELLQLRNFTDISEK